MYILLFSRTILFALIQFLISFFTFNSSKYWPLVATLGSLISFIYLLKLLKKENLNNRNFFHIKEKLNKKDILTLIFFILLLFPVAFLPNIVLGKILLDSSENSLNLLVSEMPNWIKYLSISLFPISIAISEIPIYYGYVLPKLSKTIGNYKSVFLVTFFHSLQHIFLPFLYNLNFIAWRFFMFLPFAILIALILKKRPKLLPYIMFLHFLMDLSTGLLIYFY